MHFHHKEHEKKEVEFPTTIAAILEKILQVDPVKYAKTRNHVDGDVTYLSPYISRGVITPKQVLETVLAKGYKPYEIEKFIQELAWREYYQRVWQAKGNDIWSDLKQDQPDIAHRSMIANLQEAKTRIDAIDQHIKLLYENGYMHNHIRMYVAALACNVGRAHWLQPATWLYYHLLDGDAASNNCSWQWVASSFSSKKYYFDQENVNRFTGSKQHKSYMNIPYEEMPDMDIPESLRETCTLDLKTILPKTDFPILDTNLPTLIYNSYNLDPQWRKDIEANRVLLLEPSHFKDYPISENVLQFIIDLSKNIDGIQIFVGELSDIRNAYPVYNNGDIIFKEHPVFKHYKGVQDEREWMFPQVTGFHNSFFAYWKKCEKILKQN
jgi:deoxyribodipyrimidine photo-lyase